MIASFGADTKAGSVAAVLGALLCLTGCDGGVPSYYTPIPASKEADQLVHGKLDPSRIDRIIVYVRPRTSPKDYLQDLEHGHRVVVVTGQQAARDLVRALAYEQSGFSEGPAESDPSVSDGTIRVVLNDGSNHYLAYALDKEWQDIEAPSDDGLWEGLGRSTNTWRSWLERYVYDALEPDPDMDGERLDPGPSEEDGETMPSHPLRVLALPHRPPPASPPPLTPRWTNRYGTAWSGTCWPPGR